MNPYSFKQTYIQKIVCRQCGKILGERVKNKTGDILEFSKETTCEECKRKNALNSKIRMVLNNPNAPKNQIEAENKFAKEYLSGKGNLDLKENLVLVLLKILDLKKENEIKQKIAQNYLNASKRMKESNPMFNKDTVEKVRQTQKELREQGKIKLPRGSERNSFVGTRSIQNYIRTRLYPWKKMNFERTNYTCERCGKHGGTLQVHHLEPFIKIYKFFIKKNDFDESTLTYMSPEYQKLEKDILDYHYKHNIGMVVCEDCHAEIDKHYHKRHQKEREL